MSRQLFLLAFICAGITSVYSNTNYRLNRTLVPSAYTISITPYFDTGDSRAFTFDGEVTITFVPGSTTDTIKLHSEDLEIIASNITLRSGLNTVSLHTEIPLEFEDDYTFVYLNFNTQLLPGVEYVLNIPYQGIIRDDLNGFYSNSYIENGVKKWLGATQMQSTHARKVFPCFDEPHLKAVFTLIIDRPQNYKPTLTNTKLQSSVALPNGFIRETFHPTPKMSTYLVAFLISEFEAGATITLGGNEIGVYSRPEAKNQSEYALDFSQRVVQALSDYYGIDYYSTDTNMKLDHVALPNFYAGAMENWGLVKYREALLLYLPEESTPYFKYRVAQTIAHETAHMWFGNLVTCHWWSDTWLNEGFANYFQDYITNLIEPSLGSGDTLVIGSVHSAYVADSTPDSPPISKNNINSPAEIDGHFGKISYQKAGSVIRMMHHLIGDDAFKFGLNAYLTENKFGSGYPDTLYSSLTQGINNFNSSSNYTGFNFTSIMSSWITQPGYPILNVEVDHDNSSIILTQKRFYINSSHSSDEIYKIPITYSLNKDFDFENTKPAFIMENKTYVLQIQEIKANHSWPIFNIQETGLYRVNYDRRTWSNISEHLKGSKREQIHYINRAKIVNDLFTFLFADEVQFEILSDVLHFLKNEREYAVWNAAIRGFNLLRNYYLGSDTLALIDNFALHLMENIIKHLGYKVRSTDDFVTLRNRMQVMEFACKLGHQGCIDNALAYYQDFKKHGKWIDPSLRPVAYCTGLRFGNGEDYDFLWHRMNTSNVATEIWIIAEVLGCTPDKDKLNSYLVSMLVENSPIKTQSLTVPLGSVLSNYSNVHVVFESIRANLSLWKSIYPSMGSVLSTVANNLHTQGDFDKFELWLCSCSECGDPLVKTAKAALNKAKAVTAWADNQKSYIWSSLKSDARKLSAPILLLVLSVITLANVF